LADEELLTQLPEELQESSVHSLPSLQLSHASPFVPQALVDVPATQVLGPLQQPPHSPFAMQRHPSDSQFNPSSHSTPAMLQMHEPATQLSATAAVQMLPQLPQFAVSFCRSLQVAWVGQQVSFD
jgi:hypothetical protein